MTKLENEYEYLEQNHIKDEEEEEEAENIINQELDLRNSTIKMKRQKEILLILIHLKLTICSKLGFPKN